MGSKSTLWPEWGLCIRLPQVPTPLSASQLYHHGNLTYGLTAMSQSTSLQPESLGLHYASSLSMSVKDFGARGRLGPLLWLPGVPRALISGLSFLGT